MRLKLNILNHCVETEIRSIYNSRVRACLKGGVVSDSDEEIIELLKTMLETVDFYSLRSSLINLGLRDPGLGGSGLRALEGEVILVWEGGSVGESYSRVWIEINNERIGIDCPWRITAKKG